ncbi:MAG: NAD(P)-binding domain-containing protein [Gaiellaceae bacterium]
MLTILALWPLRLLAYRLIEQIKPEENRITVERGRIGQRWHERWDSLTLLSPNWMNRLPGAPASDDHGGFLRRAEVIEHLESYARSFAAPVVEGVEVTRVERRPAGFRVETTHGIWLARTVVLATGDAAEPRVPLPPPRGIVSLHSADYRRPEDLPAGPVLIVGAGATGQQLALELRREGRAVVLSVGRHSRAPRRYRGRDIYEWLDVLGDFDQTIDDLPDLEAAKRVPVFPLSGANGGEDIGLDRLAALGVTITGRLERFSGSRAEFADDLAENVAAADARLHKLLRRIDAHPLARGTQPDRPVDVILPPAPRGVDLHGFGALVWATGFGRAYPWLRIDGALDRSGEIVQRYGVTPVPGLYVLGLAYQHRRSSHFIGGVGHDANAIAHSIVGSPARRRRGAVRRLAAAALGALLLMPVATATAAKRPRPTDVPAAETAIAPNGFQVYNDYASPERTHSSQRVVVHYVVLGIDAPPLNDDDADGVPDYVERVGEAADRALAYYERRGFRLPLVDTGGPDARPDVYVSRFAPGTLGVAFPSAGAAGGAFVVVSNNLDPSAERSFASLYATVAHELFHIVQFSYFPADAEPAIPPWILEGTAAALETRIVPDLDDIVSAIQLRRWFSATERSIVSQSYGAQLLWERLDTEQPRLLPALFRRLAARPVADEGERAVAATYARIAGEPFFSAFHRYAVSVAADHADAIRPVFDLRAGASRRAAVAPLGVHYVRPVFPRDGAFAITVTFPSGRSSAAATLTYELESEVAGGQPHPRRIAGRSSRDGRTLSFAVPARVRTDPRTTNPLLVVTNGGEQRVRYAVSARRASKST